MRTKTAKTIKLTHRLLRDAVATPCVCGGFADRVDSTKAEIASGLNCGKSYECCCRAFVCRVCKKRLTGSAFATETALQKGGQVTWNNRIMQHKGALGGPTFALHEVHYDSDEAPEME